MNILFEGEKLNFKNIIEYPDFKIFSQKTTFLTGSSGVGKSTLFRMFNRTLTPLSGKLYYKGKPIEEYSPISLRREVMLLSQDVFLFSGSIYDNFCKFYEYSEAEAPGKELIKNYLELCALSVPLDFKCDSLSGGERQRVMLAIYLSFSPSVLLLDEPTSALDFETASVLLDNLTSYAKRAEITPIIISHSEKLTEKFAQEQISLERGEPIWEHSN